MILLALFSGLNSINRLVWSRPTSEGAVQVSEAPPLHLLLLLPTFSLHHPTTVPNPLLLLLIHSNI